MSAGGIAVVVIAEQRTSLDFAAGMHWQGVGLELVESFAGSRLSTYFLVWMLLERLRCRSEQPGEARGMLPVSSLLVHPRSKRFLALSSRWCFLGLLEA
jgi:hypothetical protein